MSSSLKPKVGKRIAFFLLLPALLCALPGGTAGAQPPRERTITLRREYLMLGDLLKEVAQQTGTPLAVHREDEWALGVRMAASLREMKLTTFMESIESLFTHHYNSAKWRRAGGEKAGYLLKFGRPPGVAAAMARAEMMEMLKQDARESHRLAGLPPAVRLAAANNNPALIRPSFVTHRMFELLTALSAQDMERLLNGEEITVQWNRLSPAARKGSNLGVTYGDEPLDAERPGPLRFRMSRPSMGMGPMIAVTNVDGFSSNIAGGPGIDRKLLEKYSDGWLTPYSPICEKVNGEYHALPREDERRKHFPARKKVRWMMLLADSHDRDLLAEYEAAANLGVGGSPFRLGEWEDDLPLFVWGAKFMARDDPEVLLARGMFSLVSDRSETIAYHLYNRLHRQAVSGDGFLDLDAQEELLKLTPARLKQTAELLGVGMSDDRELLPLLAFRARLLPTWKRRLSSEKGLPLREAGLPARQVLLAAAGRQDDPAQRTPTGHEHQHAENKALPWRLLETWAGLRVRMWMEDPPKRPVRPVRPETSPEPPARLVKWAIYPLGDDEKPIHTWSRTIHPSRELGSSELFYDGPLPPRPPKKSVR